MLVACVGWKTKIDWQREEKQDLVQRCGYRVVVFEDDRKRMELSAEAGWDRNVLLGAVY